MESKHPSLHSTHPPVTHIYHKCFYTRRVRSDFIFKLILKLNLPQYTSSNICNYEVSITLQCLAAVCCFWNTWFIQVTCIVTELSNQKNEVIVIIAHVAEWSPPCLPAVLPWILIYWATYTSCFLSGLTSSAQWSSIRWVYIFIILLTLCSLQWKNI